METNEDDEKCSKSKCFQKEEHFEEHRRSLENFIDKLEHQNFVHRFEILRKDKVIEDLQLENEELKRRNNQLENENAINENHENATKLKAGDVIPQMGSEDGSSSLEKSGTLREGSVDHGKSGGSQGSGQNDSQTNESFSLPENPGNDVELKEDDISLGHPGGN